MTAPSRGAADRPDVPDHELFRCIGRGAFGEVWLARNVLGTYRAVKVVCRRSFDDDRRYEREFAGVQKFEPVSRSHESLVDLLHVGRNDAAGYFYYVMELADDAEVPDTLPATRRLKLDTYAPKTLTKAHLPFEECLSVGISLTGALDHLHKKGLLHRDIKPSNIIVVCGVPKLADIGLVTTVSDAGTFVGTDGFIPPEGPGTIQADIYALGKVLYEISTGKDGLAFPEMLNTPPDDSNQRKLAAFRKLILRACENDPQRRYKSAAEMQSDLRLIQTGKTDQDLPKLGELKYYIYISDLKIGVLFSQIQKGTRARLAAELDLELGLLDRTDGALECGESRLIKLSLVRSYIESLANVGTIDEPGEYFGGILKVRWGPYHSFRGEPTFVYFGGATKKTILGLGGSARHVIGATGKSEAHSHSATPVLIAALCKEFGLPEPEFGRSNFLERSKNSDGTVRPSNVLVAVELATTQMPGPEQRVEFLAKRLLFGTVQGQNVLLGTPLYVALAD